MKWSGFMNLSSLQLQHYNRYNLHTDSRRQRQQHSQRSHRRDLAAILPHNIGPKMLNKLPDYIRLEWNRHKFTSLLKSINTWFKAFYRQIILCSKVLLGRSFLWLWFFQLQLEILDSSSRPNLVRCFNSVWYGFKVVFVRTL